MSRLVARVRAWWHRRAIEATIDEELDFHVEMESEAHRRRGVRADDARRRALADFGGATQIHEMITDVRTPTPQARLSALRQDVQYALRYFRRTPAFTCGLVLTLALGVGANGAVFSILRAVLLQPLPYRDPSHLAMAWIGPVHPPVADRVVLQQVMRRAPSAVQAAALHQQAGRAFIDSATYMSWQGDLDPQFDLTVGDHTERLRGAFATSNFFELLGVSAARGRVFTPADASSHEALLVLSDALWHRDFGGNPAVIGQTISMVEGRPRRASVFTIIGVLPPTFRFTYPLETEAWAVLPWSDVAEGLSRTGFWTVVRTSAGQSTMIAQAKADRLPGVNADETLRLEPIADWVVADTRPTLLLLAGVALVLLLVTCATVAGALFVRIADRRRELAVRTALGADRRRLVRQLLTEGALLSATGAGLGAGLAALLSPILRALVPPTIPRVGDITVDLATLAFFAATAGAVTIAAALAPALRGTRVDLASSMKAGAATTSSDRGTMRWRSALIGIETALASGLLLTATLLLVSFWRLTHVSLGFSGERVVTAEMRLLSPKYSPPPTPKGAPKAVSTTLLAFQDQLVAGVRAMPGVVDAGLTSAVPFRGVDFMMVFKRPGSTTRVEGRGRYVDAGYFSVLRVPLIKGRLFTAADTPTSPHVVVISESFAQKMFGTEDPLGKAADGDPLVTVIGVVGDMRYERADADPASAIYFSRAQTPENLVCVVARTTPAAGNLAPAIRRLVHQLDPEVPAMNVTTVDQIIADSVADRRFYVTATTAFAGLALVLTLGGLVVVIARAVIERTRELAIRAALGASTSRLARLIVQSSLVPIVAGLAVGLASVFAGATVLGQFLYATAPRTPWPYLGVGALVLVVSALASLVPVRRASSISPIVALRSE
jgi:predicted permease